MSERKSTQIKGNDAFFPLQYCSSLSSVILIVILILTLLIIIIKHITNYILKK